MILFVLVASLAVSLFTTYIPTKALPLLKAVASVCQSRKTKNQHQELFGKNFKQFLVKKNSMAKILSQNYSYANNSSGELIHVSTAQRCEEYFCPICGELMTPHMGKVRRWHFVHKNAGNCSYESYLQTGLGWFYQPSSFLSYFQNGKSLQYLFCKDFCKDLTIFANI